MEKECMIILKHFKSYPEEIKAIEKSFGKMNINEESDNFKLQSSAQADRFKLFQEIRMLDHFNRKKHQWIWQELGDKLFKLFKQFPNEHAVIKKSLKFSNATYHRLMKESMRRGLDKRSIKRAERNTKWLNSLEKPLIKLMIRPPTTPLTLNEI